MIRSLWQIDFITAAGTSRLLSYGDGIADEIRFRVAAKADEYAPIGAAWGGTTTDGGALTSFGWTTRRDHDDHAALRAFCMRHASQFPGTRAGMIRVAVQDGETWEMDKATLATSEPAPLVQSGGFRTVTTYAVTGGRLVPVEPIEPYAGMPVEFILQPVEELTEPIESY